MGESSSAGYRIRESGSVPLIFLAVIGFVVAGVLAAISYIQHSEIQQYRDEVDEKQSDLKKQNDALLKQLELLKKDKERIDEELSDVKIKLSKEEMSKESLQRKVDEQKEKISELLRKISEMDDIKDVLAEKETKVKSLEQDLRREREKLARIKSEMESIKKAMGGYTGTVKALQDELGKANAELSSTRERLATAITERKQMERLLRTQIESKDARIKSLMSILKERETALEKKDSEIASLRETLGRKNVEVQEIQSLKDAIRARDEKIKELEEELKSRSESEERLKTLENELIRRRAEVEDLRARLKDAEESLKKVAAAKAGDAAKLQVTVIEKEKEIKALRETLDELAAKKEKLEEERESLLTQLKKREEREEQLAKKFVEELHFATGPQSTRGEMSISVSSDTLAGTKISLEQALGIELDRVDLFADFYAIGRFGFSVHYLQLSYSGTTSLTENIDFAGMSATVGDTVESSFSSFQFDVALHLNLGSIVKSGYKRVDLGLFAGGRYIKCTGEIENITTGNRGSDSLSTILPFAGFSLSYYLGTDVEMTLKALGMAYSYGEYAATNFIEGVLGVSLRLTNLLSLQTGYIFSNMHYGYESADTNEDFYVEHSYQGPYLALVVVF